MYTLDFSPDYECKIIVLAVSKGREAGRDTTLQSHPTKASEHEKLSPASPRLVIFAVYTLDFSPDYESEIIIFAVPKLDVEAVALGTQHRLWRR